MGLVRPVGETARRAAAAGEDAAATVAAVPDAEGTLDRRLSAANCAWNRATVDEAESGPESTACACLLSGWARGRAEGEAKEGSAKGSEEEGLGLLPAA